MIKKVIEYYEAYEEVLKIENFHMELGKEDAGVLCGLIREYKPRNIVEVGVAAGGSTCLIMKTLEKLGEEGRNTKLYSFDLNKNFYKDKKQETGYIWNNIKYQYSNSENQKYYLGTFAVDRIKEIQEIAPIDFIFLDTVHFLPGEVLDFLLFLPYLSQNAIVILHDTNIHNRILLHREAYSNRVLLSCVTANKFYMNGYNFLNIGAFQVCEDTKKYIADVFSVLLLPWSYHVDENVIKKYEIEYKKFYDEQVLNIWKDAVNIALRIQKQKEVLDNVFQKEEEVYIYGYGYIGKNMYNYLKKKRYNVTGIVLSDGICKEDFDCEKEIYYISEIEKKKITLSWWLLRHKKLKTYSVKEILDISLLMENYGKVLFKN